MRENKKPTTTFSRPEIASLRLEEGLGRRYRGRQASGKEAVVFSLLEKRRKPTLRSVSRKTSEAVMNLMNTLHDEYGEHFFRSLKPLPWKRQRFVTEWRTGAAKFFRPSVPPGSVLRTSDTMACSGPLSQRELYRGFTDEDILTAADELNGRPRKKLGYCTPEEPLRLFWMLSTQPDGCGNLAHG